MPTKTSPVDDYLAKVTPEQRVALEKVRKVIRTVAPTAEEYISYGLAAFRLDGKPLVALGATKTHCGFYPMSGTTVAEFAAELTDFETSKGTIRFTPDRPLSAAMIKKLVQSRIAQNGASAGTKKKASPTRRDAAVDERLRAIGHPMAAEVEALRTLILATSPRVAEAVKWNSPSYRVDEFFATINLAAKDRVRLILHTGAKGTGHGVTAETVKDPKGLLQWLGKDRAMVEILAGETVPSAAIKSILRQWIGAVG